MFVIYTNYKTYEILSESFIIIIFFHFHQVYRAEWYQLRTGYNDSRYMGKLSDQKVWSCDELDTTAGSQLLKATLTESYTSLKVEVKMKPPVPNFNLTHPKCDKAPSLLMTHDSSAPITNGLTCNPYCEVPHPCQFVEVSQVSTVKIKYHFLCHCLVQSCNELFVILRAEMNNSTGKICDILMENL